MEKTKKRNVILFDNDPEEFQEYISGIKNGSHLKWDAIRLKANEPQTFKWQVFRRYLKYFVLPLHVYSKREKYKVIVGWQSFYAINFALYCRLFKPKKENIVIALTAYNYSITFPFFHFFLLHLQPIRAIMTSNSKNQK